MKQYLELVKTVLEEGTRKENRTGIDTLSYFCGNFRHDMQTGFPLLTTKKMHWPAIVHELLWFNSGATDIQYLLDNNVHIWDEWSDQAEWATLEPVVGNPLAFRLQLPGMEPLTKTQDVGEKMLRDRGFRSHSAIKWVKGKGNTDAGYGRWWRRFPYAEKEPDGEGLNDYGKTVQKEFDQLDWAIKELKRNPMSRRVVITAWNPPAAAVAKLPSCHYTYALNVQMIRRCVCSCGRWTSGIFSNRYSAVPVRCPRCDVEVAATTRPELCLHWTQRSCDIGLGVPFNIASYGLQLAIIAREIGLPAGILAGTLIDLHAYTAKPDGSKAEYDHVPALQGQLQRTPRALPQLEIRDGAMGWEQLTYADFELIEYDPHNPIKMRVAV